MSVILYFRLGEKFYLFYKYKSLIKLGRVLDNKIVNIDTDDSLKIKRIIKLLFSNNIHISDLYENDFEYLDDSNIKLGKVQGSTITLSLSDDKKNNFLNNCERLKEIEKSVQVENDSNKITFDGRIEGFDDQNYIDTEQEVSEKIEDKPEDSEYNETDEEVEQEEELEDSEYDETDEEVEQEEELEDSEYGETDEEVEQEEELEDSEYNKTDEEVEQEEELEDSEYDETDEEVEQEEELEDSEYDETDEEVEQEEELEDSEYDETNEEVEQEEELEDSEYDETDEEVEQKDELEDSEYDETDEEVEQGEELEDSEYDETDEEVEQEEELEDSEYGETDEEVEQNDVDKDDSILIEKKVSEDLEVESTIKELIEKKSGSRRKIKYGKIIVFMLITLVVLGMLSYFIISRVFKQTYLNKYKINNEQTYTIKNNVEFVKINNKNDFNFYDSFINFYNPYTDFELLRTDLENVNLYKSDAVNLTITYNEKDTNFDTFYSNIPSIDMDIKEILMNKNVYSNSDLIYECLLNINNTVNINSSKEQIINKYVFDLLSSKVIPNNTESFINKFIVFTGDKKGFAYITDNKITIELSNVNGSTSIVYDYINNEVPRLNNDEIISLVSSSQLKNN